MVVAEPVTPSNSLKKRTPKLILLTNVAKAKFNIHIHTHMPEYSFEYLIFSRNKRNFGFYFSLFSSFILFFFSFCFFVSLYPFQLMTLQFEIKFGL